MVVENIYRYLQEDEARRLERAEPRFVQVLRLWVVDFLAYVMRHKWPSLGLLLVALGYLYSSNVWSTMTTSFVTGLVCAKKPRRPASAA